MDYLEDKVTKEILFGGGAGGGKSALLCYFGAKQCVKYPGTRGLIGRAILKTLKETTLKTFWEIVEMQGVKSMFKPYGTDLIKCSNGSEIILKDLYAYPLDPDFDELGSLELTWAAVDEANQITVKAKNVLKSRIRYKLKENNLTPKILYACNPAKNWVKTEFRDPAIKGILNPKKRFVQSLLHDNPYIYEGYEENLLELDDASRERLLFGNWEYSNDVSSLMTADEIQAIFTNDFVKGSGIKYITCDVARLGTDKTVIRVWDGWRVIQRVVLEQQRTTVTAQVIKDLASKYQIPMHKVMCDEDGVGGGVVDQLKCKGFVANSSPVPQPNKKYLANYGMFKDQCAWHLASKVKANEVYEKADGSVKETLEQELEMIKEANMDRDAKRRLLSKDKVKVAIGRSPDDSDTYLMRAAFDLIKVGGMGIVTGSTPTTTNRRTI